MYRLINVADYLEGLVLRRRTTKFSTSRATSRQKLEEINLLADNDKIVHKSKDFVQNQAPKPFTNNIDHAKQNLNNVAYSNIENQ